MISGSDRDRGILTTDDRDYLIGRKNLGTGSERNARNRIRDRTRNGLYDFEHLTTELAKKDVSQIATKDGTADEQIFNGAEYAIAFLFKLCQYAPDNETYTTDELFREVLRNGIEKALVDGHTVLDFKLDIKYGSPRDAQIGLHKKIRRGDAITLAELREALRNNYLDDTFRFEPVDRHGLPMCVDPGDPFSYDDHGSYPNR